MRWAHMKCYAERFCKLCPKGVLIESGLLIQEVRIWSWPARLTTKVKVYCNSFVCTLARRERVFDAASAMCTTPFPCSAEGLQYNTDELRLQREVQLLADLRRPKEARVSTLEFAS